MADMSIAAQDECITVSESPTLDIKTRILLFTVRRALIMVLCALEDYLHVEHTRKR